MFGVVCAPFNRAGRSCRQRKACLAEKRANDGFETVISVRPVEEAIAALNRRPALLLLVGDEEPGMDSEPWYVPSRWRQLYRWHASQPRLFASDSLWADLNGDLIPDIPVGRIPVRTPESLKPAINKIIAFENRQPTVDDLRLNVWAGTPAYNPVMDSMSSWLLMSTLQRAAPPWAQLWAISANPSHALCAWPGQQGKLFTQQIEQGGAMAVLIGHGSADEFYSMRFNGRYITYAASDARDNLSKSQPTAPMVIIACDTGSFAGHRDCLSESLLLMPGGPVAVIAATTNSHPMTNYFSGVCLLEALNQKEKRLGTLWLSTQQAAMKSRDFLMERILLEVEGKLEEKINVDSLRRDQVLMYALLGDPATRLHLPDKLNAQIKRLSDGWHWKADKPRGATRLHVSFCPAGQNLPTVQLPLEKTAALERFEQANATFAFTPLKELDIKQRWEGMIDKEGTLRLVSLGPALLHTAAFRLKQTDNPLAPER
ncbi:MAG: C25 family cysteine peptidase [Planctomycetota bacterium]|jgi:hypothetical protein